MKWNLIFRCALIGSLLAVMPACGGYKTYDENGANTTEMGYREEKENKEARSYGLQIRNIDNHKNTHLEYSQMLSDEVMGIPGIKAAIVMLTDRNAYAAIMIDATASGTLNRGNRETDNTGESRGMYNTRNGSSYADPNKLATGFNSYYTKTNHQNISHRLKQRIANKIRQLKPGVLEVYISANRDFINKMNVYSVIARRGESLKPYVPEFNKYVTKMFGSHRKEKQITD